MDWFESHGDLEIDTPLEEIADGVFAITQTENAAAEDTSADTEAPAPADAQKAESPAKDKKSPADQGKQDSPADSGKPAEDKPKEDSPAEGEKNAEDKPQQNSPAADEKSAGKQNGQKQKKGKHGRPLKTDPYGNPIRKKKKDAPLRSTEPVDTVKPSDIQKPQVSFMQSVATHEPDTRTQPAAQSTAQAYDHAVIQQEGDQDGQYQPKIRKMAESTRAKEVRSRRKPNDPLPYQKDSPVESLQSLPGRKKKRRKGVHLTEEIERIPEKLTEPAADLTLTAELTLTQKLAIADASMIDFSVGKPPAEEVHDIAVREKELRRKRDEARREKTFQRPEDRETVRKDLNELRTSLTLRVALLGCILLCSAVITLIDWIPGFPVPSFFSSQAAPVSYLTIQILLGLLALPLSGDLLKTGYLKLLQFRADSDSLAAMSMMSAELAAILLLPSPDMLRTGLCSVYIAVGLLSVFLNTLSKKMIVNRAIRNFEILSDGSQKYGIHYVEDEKRAENLTRGTIGDFPILAAMQPVDNPKDFLKYTFSSDMGDKFCRTAVPVMFFLSAAFSIIMAALRIDDVESVVCYGTSLFALCFSAFACTAITLISNLPMESGTKTYVRNSGLLLGYQSVDDFYDINTVMIDARTLFPRDSTRLESIELLGDARSQDVLVLAAALSRRAGSVLRNIFPAALRSDNITLPTVEDYTYDEGRGIGGWIQNKRVLLGTREMMTAHNIEGLPPAAREDEAVSMGNRVLYLSVSGTVGAMFTIHLEASKTVKHWLRALDREQIFLLVRSNDPLLSQRVIAKMFAFPEDLLKVIPARMEKEYAAETVPVKTARPSMLCAGRLPGFIQTIVGAKRIRSAAALGLILQIVTACLGFLYVLVFVLLNAYEDVTGGILLLFHLICTVVTVCSVRMKDT